MLHRDTISVYTNTMDFKSNIWSKCTLARVLQRFALTLRHFQSPRNNCVFVTNIIMTRQVLFSYRHNSWMLNLHFIVLSLSTDISANMVAMIRVNKTKWTYQRDRNNFRSGQINSLVHLAPKRPGRPQVQCTITELFPWLRKK